MPKSATDLCINGNIQEIQWIDGKAHINQIPFTGHVYTLYENQKDTSACYHYVNGLEHGMWMKYYPDGSRCEKRYYHFGKKVDSLEAWWENGSKKLLYHFKNDEYQGTCSEWNNHGTLIKEMNYNQGHEEGPQKMFYDNGKVRSNYLIQNGRRYGLLGTKNCVNVSDKIVGL